MQKTHLIVLKFLVNIVSHICSVSRFPVCDAGMWSTVKPVNHIIVPFLFNLYLFRRGFSRDHNEATTPGYHRRIPSERGRWILRHPG